MRKKTEGFTPQEVKVLKILVTGCSNKEIAEKLVVTVHTIKAHLTSIYSKLGVSNRTNAIIKVNNGGFNLHPGSEQP